MESEPPLFERKQNVVFSKKENGTSDMMETKEHPSSKSKSNITNKCLGEKSDDTLEALATNNIRIGHRNRLAESGALGPEEIRRRLSRRYSGSKVNGSEY